MMEKIIKDSMMNHLTSCDAIAPEQHGFVRAKNCITNLLETFDVLTTAHEASSPMDVIYLDFSKAFDTVPHRRLLIKLKELGINDKLLSWCDAFLSGRRQRVCLGAHKSNWAPVTSGVPQGSVLGPLLFVIYINDLPKRLKNIIKMYADDTKILASIQSEADRARLQKDLDELMEWIKEWQLQLNDGKCKVMHTGINNPNFNYQINGKNLSESYEEKDLGIIFQSGLKWGAQVEIAAAKANRVIGQIRRSFRCRDPKIVKLLYTSLVRPHIEYANSIWNPYFQKDIDRLERVQRRATKTGCLSHLSYQDRLKALKLTPLTERRLR